MFECLVKYKQKVAENESIGKSPPPIPDYIGECFDKLCKNLSTKGNFSGYSRHWKEEMISDGMVDCVAAVNNFNPERTENPFSYFTMIAWNAFLRRIKSEKKQVYVKHKNFENNVLLNSEWLESENGQLNANEYSSEIVRDFEKRGEKKVLTGIPKKSIIRRKSVKQEPNNE